MTNSFFHWILHSLQQHNLLIINMYIKFLVHTVNSNIYDKMTTMVLLI